MVRLIIGLAACAAMAMADVTFNVVYLRDEPTDECAVEINGKVTKLTTSNDLYPLWSANVPDVEGPLEYKYVQLKGGKVEKQEKEVRKLPEGAVHTPNEFFERTTTLNQLPPLPQVFENKFEQNSPFFREGYIANMFVEGDAAQIKYLNKGGESFHPEPIQVKVQYIGANENIKIENVRFGLSGASAREFSKQAYQFKFPKKNRLLDLSTLKLRNEETDATMIREKIYVDILNSLGVPAQQSAYVRLFFNGKPVGLYVAVEEMKKHWIKKVLHPDVKKVKPGALWKMNSCCGHEGNLQWLGATTKSYVLDDIYKNILPGKNPKDDLMQDLIAFMKDLKDYDPKKTKDPIAFWNQRLDLDVFLKSMAMEYLTGSWDSYWNSGSNYQIYNDPITGKWTWLPTDFDDTFGTSFEGKLESYRAIPKLNAKGFESPLAQKLIMETPEINQRFEQILKDIVSYVFKPDALTPRLDAYKNMIEDDVAWDRAQPRLAKGKSEKFTAEDLTKGLADGTKGNWGLKKWITKRSEGVQKDLKFEAVDGNPTKIPYHTVNNVENAFGIGPKEEVDAATVKNIVNKSSVSKSVTVSNINKSNNNGPTNNDSNGKDDEDLVNASSVKQKPVTNVVSTQSDGTTAWKNQPVQKAVSSAQILTSRWAALSAVIAVVVLAF
ncbi:coth protein-domain-containing protein [Dissophora ornata]|nr:hypothetical protein BGZ58_009917 [Dissophora ornata]KAI8596209.1 coth protein-domain-containing protein [Dissophora ornata]